MNIEEKVNHENQINQKKLLRMTEIVDIGKLFKYNRDTKEVIGFGNNELLNAHDYFGEKKPFQNDYAEPLIDIEKVNFTII